MTGRYTPGYWLIFRGAVYNVAYRSSYTLSLIDIPVYTPGDRLLYPMLQTNILGNSVADRYLYTLSLTYSGMYSSWQTAIPGYSVAYRSYYTLSLTDILVQGRGCYTLSYRLVTDWYFGVQCSWQVFVYSVFDWYSDIHFRWQAALPWVTDWYSDVQCSLQVLVYSVTDLYSSILSIIPRVTDWYTG